VPKIPIVVVKQTNARLNIDLSLARTRVRDQHDLVVEPLLLPVAAEARADDGKAAEEIDQRGGGCSG
jgi:hypothetical protein